MKYYDDDGETAIYESHLLREMWIEICSLVHNAIFEKSHLLRVMLIETIWKIILMSTNL